MKIILLNIVLLCFFNSESLGLEIPGDSASANTKPKSNVRLTTRLHSIGLFNFAGMMASDNPAFDINVTYDRPGWGAMVFSAVDLYDQHSFNNFALTLLYRRIKIGKRLTVTPNVGYLVEDWGKEIADRSLLITSFKVSPKLTIDNTSIFANIVIHHDLDWVNRFRFLYAVDNHLDITGSIWHNNRMLDHADYFSYGVSVFYNRIKISESVSISMGVSSLIMAVTSDEKDCPKKNGLMLTVAAVFD